MLRISKWVQHCFNVYGCKEGMVTIDGNEKIRAMCAAPTSKVIYPVNHINLVQCCSRSPITGSRHQSSSRFCSEQHLAKHTTTSTETPLSHSEFTTSVNLGTLPDSDSDELLNVNHCFDRTAGVADMVRPCGIVVNFSEMFSFESPTRCISFLCLLSHMAKI